LNLCNFYNKLLIFFKLIDGTSGIKGGHGLAGDKGEEGKLFSAFYTDYINQIIYWFWNV